MIAMDARPDAVCEIDWAAWGTWAAVVVALGIAVADKVFTFFQRRRETKILALVVFSELEMLSRRLRELSDFVNPNQGEADSRDWFDASVAASPIERLELRQAGEGIEAPAIQSTVERLPNVQAELGEKLATILGLVRIIRVGCSEPADTPEGKDFDAAQRHMADLRRNISHAQTCVREALIKIESLAPK